MLHAAWDHGRFAVLGWSNRALSPESVEALTARLFARDDLERVSHVTTLPGKRQPTTLHGVWVPLDVAAEAFTVFDWVPWRSLGASLAWLADVTALANRAADVGAVIPAVDVLPGPVAVARWRPMVDERMGTTLARLASTMPPVVGLLHEQPPWQLTAAIVEAMVDDAARVRLWGAAAGGPPARQRSGTAVAARRVLTGLVDDPVLVVDPPLLALAGALSGWTDGVSGRSPLADVDVTVRIVAPGEEQPTDSGRDDDLVDRHPEERPWLAALSVAPVNDPSLESTAAQVWEGKAAGLSAPRAQGALRALRRRCVDVAPTLAAALDPERPSDGELDIESVMTVLRDEASALGDVGIRVLLPRWWSERARIAVRGAAQPAPVTEAGLTARSLVEIDWTVAIDGLTLKPAELQRLADSKQDLIRLRGKWVAFDRAAVERALTALTRHQRTRSVVDANELVALGADPEVEIDAREWAAELLAGLPDDRLEPVDEPASFIGTLRPYQRRGLGWLAFIDRLGLGGVLADDMGLGKTAQLLALLLHERRTGDDARPVGPTLVVCPLSVVHNWHTEAARFAPSLRTMVHHGVDRTEVPFADLDLVITTYATAARDQELLGAVTWQRIVADEAQHVKNSGTRAAKALRALPARQKLALTGTPVENRLTDLWSIFHLVNPGLLGSAESFRQRYAIPIERHRDHEVTARLQQIVQPFLLRRTKADRTLVPELPDKIEQTAWAQLTREQASLYKAIADDLIAKLKAMRTDDGIDRRGAILGAITRLKQVCNHPAHLLGDGSRIAGRSGKLTRFDELIDDALASEEQVLVFTQFVGMGHILQTHLKERHHLDTPFLSGAVAKRRRDAMVERFQDGSGGPVLIVSLKAGGSGLNLTAASQVIHYDRWWNPAVEDQASDRAWRIGQLNTVVVHKMVCRGTIEERVDELINAKRELADRVVGSGEGWLTELSTADLADVIALRAVEDS